MFWLFDLENNYFDVNIFSRIHPERCINHIKEKSQKAHALESVLSTKGDSSPKKA
jgi:hypothetical protein